MARGRASRTPIGQAIELLMQDHREVERMFRQAQRAKNDPARLQEIVEACCRALTQHADIEEQYFYPVLREAIDDTELIAEAEIEHATARQLIAQLEGGSAEDVEYVACFKVLSEYVKHHIEEEEDSIFPKARRSGGDFQPLLDALQARGEARQAESAGQAGEQERAPARGRQGRGRQSPTAAGRGVDESMGRQRGSNAESEEDTVGEGDATVAGDTETIEGDVEQPRRGRRSSALESGDTESVRGRDQEPGEEGVQRSRPAGR